MTNHAPRTASRSGYTLAELLVVVTITGLLAAMTVVAATSSGPEALVAASRVAASDVRLARSLAVQYGQPFKVVFDAPNHAYEIRYAGTGTAPPIVDPLAPAGSTSGTYRVALRTFVRTAGGDTGIRWGGAALVTSGSSVSDVTFGALGGTGPARSEDTVLRLVESSGPGKKPRAVDVTVSWITGDVRIGDPFVLGGP